MRYVSHLACPTCGATYPGRPGDEPLRAGRPAGADGPRPRAARRPSAGRDGGWDPTAATSGGSAGSCRWTSPTPTTAATSSRWARDTRRSLAYPHPLADRLALPAGGQGRGPPARRLRRQPDALVQGPGDGDDGLDGPGARALAAGRADPGERGRLAGRVRRRGRDRGGVVMSPDTDLPVLGKVAALRPAPPDHVTLELVAGHDHRLRPADPRALRPARLFQRRHLPGARLADRGEEDARPGDGRARRRPAGRRGAGSCPT